MDTGLTHCDQERDTNGQDNHVSFLLPRNVVAIRCGLLALGDYIIAGSLDLSGKVWVSRNHLCHRSYGLPEWGER